MLSRMKIYRALQQLHFSQVVQVASPSKTPLTEAHPFNTIFRVSYFRAYGAFDSHEPLIAPTNVQKVDPMPFSAISTNSIGSLYKSPVLRMVEKTIESGLVSSDKPKTLGKMEFLKRASRTSGSKAVDLEVFFNHLLAELKEAIQSGETVSLKGFGSLKKVEKTFTFPESFLKTPGPVTRKIVRSTAFRPVFTAGTTLKSILDKSRESGNLSYDPRDVVKSRGATNSLNSNNLAHRALQKVEFQSGSTELWMDSIILELTRALIKGERVSLHNFGSFEAKVRAFKVKFKKEEEGKVVIRTVVKFTVAPQFVKMLNEGKEGGKEKGGKEEPSKER